LLNKLPLENLGIGTYNCKLRFVYTYHKRNTYRHTNIISIDPIVSRNNYYIIEYLPTHTHCDHQSITSSGWSRRYIGIYNRYIYIYYSDTEDHEDDHGGRDVDFPGHTTVGIRGSVKVFEHTRRYWSARSTVGQR